jgi:hypothetical protein
MYIPTKLFISPSPTESSQKSKTRGCFRLPDNANGPKPLPPSLTVSLRPTTISLSISDKESDNTSSTISLKIWCIQPLL